MHSHIVVTLAYATPTNGWPGRQLVMLLAAVVFLVSAVLTLLVLQLQPPAGLQANPGVSRQNAVITPDVIPLEPVLREDETWPMHGVPEEEQRQILTNPMLR
jgi:hypothetical protein